MKGAVFSLLCAIAIAQGRELPTNHSLRTCNCDPSEAQSICSKIDSNDIMIAHEYCNKFYKCANGSPVPMACNSPLLYNPYIENCDWPQNVDCGERPIFEPEPIIPEDNDSNGDNDNGSNGPCNCNPAEAPSICARDGSEGTLIAHEYCNKYYICNHGRPVGMLCGPNSYYNPYTQNCDWASNVECGDRLIPDNGGSDAGGGGDGGPGSNETGPETCNCNPEEAPSICAASGSDSVFVAHENCNQYYQCNHGIPIPMTCPDNLLYNPYIERCDWPNNVDCGNRVVPCDCEDENSEDCDESNENISNEADGNDNNSGDNSSGDNGGDSGNGGGDNGGTDNGGGDSGGGTCNCNPGEAEGICAADDSDGVLVAHEKCDQFYKCAHGVPVALLCYEGLYYNPYTEQCDWPHNVDCGDRVVPDTDGGNGGSDNGGGDSGGSDNGNGDNEGDAGNGGGDNGGTDNGGGDSGGGTCNCNPGEAEGICAADDSDGVLVAHEKCDQFYKCAHGVPVALLCYEGLYYNPYTEQCDWPYNVDCGDRVVPETDGGNGGNDNGGGDSGGSGNGNGDNGGDAGNDGGDNGGTDNGGGDSGGGTCNCNPGEAEGICAAGESDGVLVAHENCDQFYKCAHGVPVALQCNDGLYYNPYTEQCDWPYNVDCGDRVVPETDGGNGGNDNGGGDSGGSGNGNGDNGGDAGNGGGDNGGSDNGGGDSGGGTCNCNPGEAEGICAAGESDGVLVAHENCDQFYKCAHGVPVALQCNDGLYYNPYTEQCDWPHNVDCGDRVVPETDGGNGGSDNGGGDSGGSGNGNGDNEGDAGNGGGDNGGTDNGGGDSGGGTCNCNPGEAEGICAADDSDGVLVAHEKCDQFYKCAHGVPVALQCYEGLYYNPYTEQCDWPHNVDCGDRVIPDTDGGNGGSDNGGGDSGGSGNGNGDNEGDAGNGGGDNGGTDNGGGDSGGGTCNCNPGEAEGICAAGESDGVLVAHENCDQFYKCAHGVPVALLCYEGLYYNPYTEQCDWPHNVDCGDRVVPDTDGGNGGSDNGGGDSGGSDNGNGDNEGDAGNGGGDNGGTDNGGGDSGGGTCNCNPGEAEGICAADDSDGVLVAHEKCDQFYKCAHGVPVALLCYEGLYYNPYTEQCDWPYNVDCGDRVVPETDGGNGGNDNGGGDSGGSGNGNGDNGGDAGNGGGDNGGTDNGGGDSGGGTCNCNPGEAEGICAAGESDGVLVAHENCDQFYKCAHGVPVALQCNDGLYYNPYTEQCDWPYNVDCGDRVVPETDGGNGGNDNGGGDSGGSGNGNGDNGGDAGNGGGDNGGSDNGGGDSGGGTCNCNPGEAEGICAADDSDGVLVAHEKCDQFYKCAHGVPVALQCYEGLYYNPYTEQCDWPHNVDCGDRVIPDTDGGNGGSDNGGGDNDSSNNSEENNNGGGDNGGGDSGGSDNGGGDNGGGTCNCNPGEAEGICAADESDGVLVAHEKCDQFYKCAHGVPVALLCYEGLYYNPYTEQCDWPHNVDCGDRVVPETDGGNGGSDNGGGDSGGSGNGNGDNEGDAGNGGGDNGGTDNGGGDSGGGTCNCNPGEAEGICAAGESDGVLVAHENCDQFYKCAHGVPVALLCYEGLYYNPYTEQCDWPYNVDCGDRVVPETDGGNGGNDNGGGDSGGSGNGNGDNGGDAGNDGGDNGGTDNGGGDSGGGTCNCNPGEAEGICAAGESDGVLVAHENCDQFYKCAHGVPVALQCNDGLYYNPYTEQCDWPYNVDCGDRVVPETDGGNGGNDNGGGDSGGSGNGNGDNGGDAGNGGGDNGGTDNGGGDSGGGTCNCNPGEAEGICAAGESDGVLVAHENCDQFYKCAHGVPVALQCNDGLYYNPYTEQCDWPYNVDCGDRVVPETDGGNGGNDNGGGDSGGSGNGNGDNGGDAGNGGGDNGGSDNGGGDSGGGTCNCNPGEAEGICAAGESDGVLVAHENCDQFYKCAHGVPVALQCNDGLYYNPYTEQCDWPHNVDCGDRVVPDTDGGNGGNDNGGGDSGGSGNGNGDNAGDAGNGGGDNGGTDNEGGDSGGGTCNCNPGEAEGICAADDSDGVLVAHEKCDQFYKCSHGVPVALQCYEGLYYNPYTEQCDWPHNVDCGDRVIPDTDGGNGGSDNGGDDNEGGNNSEESNNGGGDNDGGDNGGGSCNCNPEEAPSKCAADGSDGILIAHEKCNKLYKCANGVPVEFKCFGNLLYNPYTERCDWPENVDCEGRVKSETEDNGNHNGGSDNGSNDNGGSDNGGVDNEGSDSGEVDNEGSDSEEVDNDGGNNDGGNNEGGDNSVGGDTCHCNPNEAQAICSENGSNDVMIAHEYCNMFYRCANGLPIAMACNPPLMYNPYIETCDWPLNVDCDGKPIYTPKPISPEDDNSNGDNGNVGNGTCNCNPAEAPSICANAGSEGTQIAHEYCNQYYVCNHGRPVAMPCGPGSYYNPYTEKCDWASNVECGDRLIPENGGGSGGPGSGETGPETCNCNPEEAPSICAAPGSDSVFIAHENCNQFYQCNHGRPVPMTCPSNLLYNPYFERCDWPNNVDCGNRVIPCDCEDEDSEDCDESNENKK